jgi:hypothetical protein
VLTVILVCSVSNSIRKVTDDISSDQVTYTLIVPTDSIFFHKVKIVLLDCKSVTAPVYQPDMDAANSTDTKTHTVYHSIM